MIFLSCVVFEIRMKHSVDAPSLPASLSGAVTVEGASQMPLHVVLAVILVVHL